MTNAKQELIKLTSDLVKFQSSKDKPQEIRKCIDFIKDYFSDGFIVKEYESNGKLSVVVSYEDKKQFKFILSGHIDVVEADDKEFIPKVEGNKLFGRGSLDMKSGVAACMLLMKEFKDKKPDMALLFTGDEESGGFDGTGYLVKQGYKADLVIAADTFTGTIQTKHKGILWAKIIAKGKGCHGSTPWKGENAAEKLFQKYFEIKKLFTPTTEKDRWKTTINLGNVKSGDAPNKVPDKAEMILDIRYTEATDPDKLVKDIKAIGDIEVKVLEKEPMFINKDDTMVNKLKQVAGEVSGKEIEITKGHGASDVRFFSAKGIPCTIYGPTGANYHGIGEYVNIDNLEIFYNILKEFIETES